MTTTSNAAAAAAAATAKIAELRAATREANACLKDLRAVARELRAARVEAEAEMAEWRLTLKQRFDEACLKSLKEYQDILIAAMDEHTKALNRRMDTICSMITTPYDTPWGRLTLEQWLKAKITHEMGGRR